MGESQQATSFEAAYFLTLTVCTSHWAQTPCKHTQMPSNASQKAHWALLSARACLTSRYKARLQQNLAVTKLLAIRALLCRMPERKALCAGSCEATFLGFPGELNTELRGNSSSRIFVLKGQAPHLASRFATTA